MMSFVVIARKRSQILEQADEEFLQCLKNNQIN